MEIHSKRQRRLSEAERAHLLEAYEQSSMTQCEFAAAHGIGLSTLTKWRRDRRRSKTSIKEDHPFIEVSHHGRFVGEAQGRFTLESPSGWRIHLPQQADIRFTQQLMELCFR